jgi:hypothetical protein
MRLAEALTQDKSLISLEKTHNTDGVSGAPGTVTKAV